MKMNVAIVAHVGQAKSHVLRALTIYEALKNNFNCVLIVPERTKPFVQEFFPNLACEWIPWYSGHNDVFELRLTEVVAQLRMTASRMKEIFDAFLPHLVIGVPGPQSSAICRALGVPHVSILHGPWLIPEYVLPELDQGEKSVLASWERAIELTDTMTNVIAHAFGQNYKGYLDWLEKERVWVAQDFEVEYKNKRPTIGFLSTDYGPVADRCLPKNCLTISLGTAIESDGVIARQVSDLGLPRLIVGGAEVRAQNMYWRPAVAGTSLASISSVALCHGGVGTIPVFAGARVPQVFVPHDIDQAVNAILARRSGFGTPIDLRYWKRRTPFGRLRPKTKADELGKLIRAVMSQPLRRTPRSNNTTAIQDLALDACR